MKLLTKLVILFTILLSVGCKKEDPTPVPPVITFLDAQFSSDKSFSIVTFEFFDGDGDLGLKQEENAGGQEYNVFVDIQEKRNGVWKLITPIVDSTFNFTTSLWEYDTTVFHVRMPFLENEANRSLEGEVEAELLFNNFGYAATPGADTFKYDLKIRDRALHLSNTISTTELIVE